MQVYLSLSRLLAGGGLAPLQALAEAEADLAALAPNAANARVGPTACVVPVVLYLNHRRRRAGTAQLQHSDQLPCAPSAGWGRCRGEWRRGMMCSLEWGASGVPGSMNAGHDKGAEHDPEGQGQRAVGHVDGLRAIPPGGPHQRKHGGRPQEVRRA